MSTRVWFRPTRPGLKVPRDPKVDPRVQFEPEGGWCEQNNYINRCVARGEGEIFSEMPEPLPIEHVAEVPELPPLEIDEALARATYVPIGGRRRIVVKPGEGKPGNSSAEMAAAIPGVSKET